MFPLRDNIPTQHFPLVTVAIILACVGIFLYEQSLGSRVLPEYETGTPVAVSGFDAFTTEWGFVPCELMSRCQFDDLGVFDDGQGGAIPARVPDHPVWLTLLTSMFMHGGWLHLGGNMLFLWIFGNNVEDSMGRLRYVLFYLLCGVLAGVAQLATDPSSAVPNIGASGAIAGVLGGYLLLFPRARVLTAVFLLVVFTIIEVPAIVVLTVWFALQFWQGSSALADPAGGGVAYWAHIGGFVAGLVLIRLFATRRKQPPALRAS